MTDEEAVKEFAKESAGMSDDTSGSVVMGELPEEVKDFFNGAFLYLQSDIIDDLQAEVSLVENVVHHDDGKKPLHVPSAIEIRFSCDMKLIEEMVQTQGATLTDFYYLLINSKDVLKSTKIEQYSLLRIVKTSTEEEVMHVGSFFVSDLEKASDRWSFEEVCLKFYTRDMIEDLLNHLRPEFGVSDERTDIEIKRSLSGRGGEWNLV